MSTQEQIREDEEVSSEVSSEPAFVCDCEPWMIPTCSRLPFYKEKEGKRYCVLHYPCKDKSEEFKIVMQQKLDAEDFDFRGIWFPDELDFIDFKFPKEADFSRATFTEAAFFSGATFTKEAYFYSTTFTKDADFYDAKFSGQAAFSGAYFTEEVDFSSASFTEKADFNKATFNEKATFGGTIFTEAAYFIDATFTKEAKFSFATFTQTANFGLAAFTKEAYFSFATFTKEANFIGATFTEKADFNKATFNEKAIFNSTTFKDYLRFAGNNERNVFTDISYLDLQFARIEKPDRASFHTLELRPHWFINVDARKFEFTNVEWMPEGFEIKKELESMKHKEIQSPYRMLSIACRHLAVNAEESHRYEEASKFRYMSMETRRMEPGRRFAFLSLHWWYWLASGYGERIGRAFLMLGAVWLLSGLLYTQVGFTRSLPTVAGADPVIDVVGEPLSFRRSFTYSLGVMSLQKPEPKPLTNTAHALVTLETIFGPVQAALLALAIRRKFMR